jgi:hypothetical protein
MANEEKELAGIEQGKYAERLTSLRRQSPNISAEEIYLLLDPTKVEKAAEAQLSLWVHRLEYWRNGLILLPLLVTWLSLGLAVLAYVQTYSPSLNQPFLMLWAGGFPGTTWPVPNFISVAVSDASLIAILLGLTIVTQWFEGRARKQAAQISSWLEAELYELALKSAVKSLGAGAENKRPAWAVEVHTAISHLNTALKGVETLVQSSERMLTNLMSRSQTTFENLVRVSHERFEGSVRQFSGGLSDQREAVKEFMKSTTEVRRAVDKLEKIYKEGENIYLGLYQTLPRIEGAFDTMATHQDKAATALELVSSRTELATKAVGDIAQQFTQADLVQNTSLAVQSMKQTAEVMYNIAVQMGNIGNQQIQLQTHLEQWASRIPSLPVNKFIPKKQRFAFLRGWFRSSKVPSSAQIKWPESDQ